MKDLVQAHVSRSVDAKQAILSNDGLIGQIAEAGQSIASAFAAGGKLLICGNGGSAADAQHIATEFVIRYTAKNVRPSLPAISLAADSSAITAGGNDFGFDTIFSRQVEGLGQKGDVLLAITTSGNSPNVIAALQASRKKGMIAIVLSGGTGGAIAAQHMGMVDRLILVPAQETSRIQECHIMIGQIFCAIAEKQMYDMD